MENFFNSLTDEQKVALKALISDSQDEATELPKEHKEALDELDPAYHDSYIKTNNLEKPKVNEDFTVSRENKKNDRRRAVRGGKNKWEDTGGEFRDVETPEFDRTPRRKAAPEKREVDCHICGRVFKVDPRYTYGEHHRCNKCTGR